MARLNLETTEVAFNESGRDARDPGKEQAFQLPT
jgi:hypothetical protein